MIPSNIYEMLEGLLSIQNKLSEIEKSSKDDIEKRLIDKQQNDSDILLDWIQGLRIEGDYPFVIEYPSTKILIPSIYEKLSTFLYRKEKYWSKRVTDLEVKLNDLNAHQNGDIDRYYMAYQSKLQLRLILAWLFQIKPDN